MAYKLEPYPEMGERSQKNFPKSPKARLVKTAKSKLGRTRKVTFDQFNLKIQVSSFSQRKNTKNMPVLLRSIKQKY